MVPYHCHHSFQAWPCYFSSGTNIIVSFVQIASITQRAMFFLSPRQTPPCFQILILPWKLPDMGWMVSPRRSAVALIISTAQCDLIWKQSLYKSNQIKMRVGQSCVTGIFTKRRNWDTNRHRGKTVRRYTGKRWPWDHSDDSTSQGKPGIAGKSQKLKEAM